MTRHDIDEHDDPIFDRIGRLDPIGHDTPPAAGSPRFNAIKENAMHTITRPESTTDYQQTDTPARPQRGASRRYRRTLLGVAAASAALIAGAVLVVNPGGTPSAEALVLDAADNLAQYDSLRATLVRDEVDGTTYAGSGDFDGRSVHTEFVATGPDGEILYTEGITVIGDTIWSQQNDEISEEQTGPNDRLTPFPEASEAVITAALEGADIEQLGTEEIRGNEADRFRIVQTDESHAALNRLTPFELAWFELESPDAVTVIDVWIADDIIQQITVVDPSYGTTTTTFYDFGADLDIQPPTND